MPRSLASIGEPMVPSCPSRRTWPSSGWWTPLRHLMSVDLPAPLSPSNASTSPRRNSRLTLSRASVAPNRFVRLRTSRIGVSFSSWPTCSCSASTSSSPRLEGAESSFEVPAQHVELHCEDDDGTRDYELPELIDVEQFEAFRDDPEDERTHQDSYAGTSTAEEAASTDDHGGDGLQLCQLACGR